MAFGKVIDNTTLLDDGGLSRNIGIDVFVYDNAPNNDASLKKMIKKAKRYYYGMILQEHTQKPKGGVVRRSVIMICRLLVKIKPKHYYVKKLIANAKSYNGTQTKNVGLFIDPSGYICDRDIFNELIDLQFEKSFYKAPKKYDEWLKICYGDYMKFPDVENRKGHDYKAFVLEDGDI